MSEETSATAAASPASVNRQPPRRIKLTDELLESITRDDLVKTCRENELYLDSVESQISTQEAELIHLRECEERIRLQHAESTHREKILVRRLATKEQEMQEYISQIAELKSDKAPGAAALRSALLDPAVNLLLQRLRQELVSTKARLEETQNELSAWKFTPDSNTGKRLMAKCRLLYQENEELGRIISSGRLAKLEGDLALQKNFSDEVKKSQSELDEFLQDLDEDVEGMQSTIYYLQQELRKAKEAIASLQQENEVLKNGPQEESDTNPATVANTDLETNPTLPEDPESKPVPLASSPIPLDTTESTEETVELPEPRERPVQMDESANLNPPTPPSAVEPPVQRDWGSSSDSNELILEADPIVDDIENEEQSEVKVEDSPKRKRSFESVDTDNAPLTKKARRDSELSLHYTGDEDLGREENNEEVEANKSPERKISDDDDGSDDTPLSHIRRDSL